MKCCHWLHRLLACGVLLAASVPALAAGDDSDKAKGDASADRHENLFKQLDKNGDGEIASDELSPEQQRMFNRLVRTGDKNSDGKLNHDEFLAGMKDAPPPREPGAGGPGRGGQMGPEQAEMMFKQMDTNGDGKIVIEEIPEERRERFTMMIERFDSDGDKSITLVEFTKGLAMGRGEQAAAAGGSQPSSMPQIPPGVVYRALDTNSDGKLSKEEIEAAPKSLETLDRNHDGEISPDELGGGGPRPYAQAGRPGGQPSQPGGDGKGFFKMLDKDGDGKISKDEAPERMKENFDKLDANGDGYIEESEFARVMQGMGRRPGDLVVLRDRVDREKVARGKVVQEKASARSQANARAYGQKQGRQAEQGRAARTDARKLR